MIELEGQHILFTAHCGIPHLTGEEAEGENHLRYHDQKSKE